MAPRTEVAALPEDEARRFLELVGIDGSFDDGSLVCCCCEESLRTHGIGAAKLVGTGVVLCCTRVQCLESLHGHA